MAAYLRCLIFLIAQVGIVISPARCGVGSSVMCGASVLASFPSCTNQPTERQSNGAVDGASVVQCAM